jgi:DNA-binding CsgD family transcriptional regulator/tetratricopeptide (TPR) repeat protein
VELWERDDALAALGDCLTDAARGDGRVVLIAGEAGVGKSALLRSFAAAQGPKLQLWWGTCDALAAPSPLAPLHDLARDSAEVADLLAGDPPRHALFAAILRLLASPLRPVMLVVDDAHWADEATLDLLIYLGRRITGRHALLVAAYRDDELGPDHPLRRVLGSLAGEPQVTRVPVARLSEDATAAVARGTTWDPAHVYRVTGGNPFFVNELLAAPPGAVPETVRDAVLARAARLTPEGRTALEVVAVVPGGTPLSLVSAVAGAASGVEECAQAGLLDVASDTVRFRHELARQAVEMQVPATRRPRLHEAVLSYLDGRADPDPARLAYHAVQAGDQRAVLAHAPTAAEQASRQGAHRQAAAHYEAALRYAGSLPPAMHASLLEGYADECNSTGRLTDAIDALEQAAQLRHDLGESDRRAMAMARRAQYLYATARGKEARDEAEQALALVNDHPPGPTVASVLSHAAYLFMASGDQEAARQVGRRAVAMSEHTGDDRVRAVALIALGGAQWHTDPAAAEAHLVKAVQAARRSGRAATVALAISGLAVGALDARRLAVAERWLAEADDWCTRHDLDRRRDTCRANQTVLYLRQARWPEATRIARELTSPDTDTYPPARRTARRTLTRLAVRRGEADQRGPLDDAWEIAVRSNDPTLLGLAAAARAEAAWHAGRIALIPELIGDTLDRVARAGDPWLIGELGFWLWRAGALPSAPDGAAEPYALHTGGDPVAAAAAWDAIGCPYEAAVARADSDDPEQMRAALEVFYRLGARPAANRLVHRMRSLGVDRLPRRPHRTTGANPAGLTERELEIVHLLTAGLSNSEISTRLHISRHTAAHHVSAVLSKLGVGSRRDAPAAARRHGVSPPG